MFPDLLSSADTFRDRFEQGLIELLRTTGELGEDILVLANANFEPRIWDHLRDELRAVFARLEDELIAADRNGRSLGAPDDVATLRQILAHGFDALRPTELRRTGPWELQFNALRAFRPARHSGARVEGIRAPFDPGRFHFDKPFLRREIIWQGTLLGRAAALFYNKFPFADYHGLLTPDLAGHRPQYMEPGDLAYFWDIGMALGEKLPGFGLGYNSYGAHASVNHLHFQTFLRTEPLPIEDPRWHHNGGAEPYPCSCFRFQSPGGAGDFIGELHGRAVSYNLIFSNGQLYCLPRRKQGEVAHAPWLGAAAWYEMAGGFPLANETAFRQMPPAEIAAQIAATDLAKTSPDVAGA